MTVCEFLHCSYSEMRMRCVSLADKMLILKYCEEKGKREKAIMDGQGKSPPITQKPRKRGTLQ